MLIMNPATYRIHDGLWGSYEPSFVQSAVLGHMCHSVQVLHTLPSAKQMGRVSEYYFKFSHIIQIYLQLA